MPITNAPSVPSVRFVTPSARPMSANTTHAAGNANFCWIVNSSRTDALPVLELFTIQQKFAFPAACVVLALIGLALGVTNRTDGTLGAFVIGIGVVMIYYTLLWSSRALA